MSDRRASPGCAAAVAQPPPELRLHGAQRPRARHPGSRGRSAPTMAAPSAGAALSQACRPDQAADRAMEPQVALSLRKALCQAGVSQALGAKSLHWTQHRVRSTWEPSLRPVPCPAALLSFTCSLDPPSTHTDQWTLLEPPFLPVTHLPSSPAPSLHLAWPLQPSPWPCMSW